MSSQRKSTALARDGMKDEGKFHFFTIHYYLLLAKNPECAGERRVNSEEVISKNPDCLRIRDF